jgi:hypothetical protein
MKPRPEPEPPTWEDLNMWAHVCCGGEWPSWSLHGVCLKDDSRGNVLAMHSRDSDRRDADLMFAARNWRDGSGPVPGVAVAWTDPPWSGPFRIGGTGPWGGKLPAAGNITNCV